MKKWIGKFFIISLLASGLGVNAQNKTLRVKGSILKMGRLAYHATDSKGKIIASGGGSISMIPASSWKVPAMHASYEELGPDYKFKTQLLIEGNVTNDGTLEGNIILKGGGDPTLGSPNLKVQPSIQELVEEWVKTILNRGIRCIDGRLIVDASFFGSEIVCPSWPWNDLGNYYGCGSWGLNIHENQNKLTFQLSNKEQKGPQLIDVQPPGPERYRNLLISGPQGSGDQAYIFGGPFQKNRVIRGSLPTGAGQMSIKGSMNEPPKYLGTILLRALNRKGVVVNNLDITYQKVDWSGRNVEVIHEIESKKLNDIISAALKMSNNLYCEAIIRTATLHSLGEGSYENVRKFIDLYLQKVLNQKDYFNLVDGSGLSPFNQISPRALCDLYQNIGQQDLSFIHLIPEASASSLSSSLPPELRRRVRVKSGYMLGVWTFAGIIDGGTSEAKYFSFMFQSKTSDSSQVRREMADLIKQIDQN